MAAIAIVRDAALGPRASVVAGVVLVGWILGEILILTADDELVSPVEAANLVLGPVMIGFGVITRRAGTGAQALVGRTTT